MCSNQLVKCTQFKLQLLGVGRHENNLGQKRGRSYGSRVPARTCNANTQSKCQVASLVVEELRLNLYLVYNIHELVLVLTTTFRFTAIFSQKIRRRKGTFRWHRLLMFISCYIFFILCCLYFFAG